MKTNPSMIMQTDEEKNKNAIKNYGNCIYQFQCEENILAKYTAVNRQNAIELGLCIVIVAYV